MRKVSRPLHESGRYRYHAAQQWEFTYHPATFDRSITNLWSGMCLDIQVNSVEEIVPGVSAQQFWCGEL